MSDTPTPPSPALVEAVDAVLNAPVGEHLCINFPNLALAIGKLREVRKSMQPQPSPWRQLAEKLCSENPTTTAKHTIEDLVAAFERVAADAEADVIAMMLKMSWDGEERLRRRMEKIMEAARAKLAGTGAKESA